MTSISSFDPSKSYKITVDKYGSVTFESSPSKNNLFDQTVSNLIQFYNAAKSAGRGETLPQINDFGKALLKSAQNVAQQAQGTDKFFSIDAHIWFVQTIIDRFDKELGITSTKISKISEEQKSNKTKVSKSDNNQGCCGGCCNCLD